MLQMIFRSVAGAPGVPVAVLPRDASGNPVVPDGLTTFDLAQAATKFARSEQSLRDLYLATFASLIEPEDAALLGNAGAEDRGSRIEDGKDAPPLTPAPPPDSQSSILHPPSSPAQRASLELLHLVRYPDLSDEQFEFFLQVCRQRRLNPWSRQIFPKPVHNPDTGLPTIEIIIGIEGFRLIAERTGKYAGRDDAVFAYIDGDVEHRVPRKCTVTVHKIIGADLTGAPIIRPFTHTVWRDEVLPTSDEDYANTQPHGHLGKCTEAAALRSAFPDELGGVYTPDELSQLPPTRAPSSILHPPSSPDPDGPTFEPDDSQLPHEERQAARASNRPARNGETRIDYEDGRQVVLT